MKYYLFIDESGDHGLDVVDPDFPVFVLCGVVFSEDAYEQFRQRVNKLKLDLWKNINVVFHSRDIRRCEKEFKILFDLETKKYFYEQLNQIIADSDYKIVSTVIDKNYYISKVGRSGNVYAVSLGFLINQTILYLDSIMMSSELEIIVEKRGKNEDVELLRQYNIYSDWGTNLLQPHKIKQFNPKLRFVSKRENINGLQLADLVAYPIARFAIEPERVNLAFEIFRSKIFDNGESSDSGLLIFRE